ncbi:MAG: ABC transporter ATP-binding protein [Pseudomonadota bacterium]
MLALVVIAMAVFEVAGVVSVMPFLAVLASPSVVETHPVLAGLYDFAGFTSTDRFLIFLGICAFLVLVIAALVRMLGQYALIRFAQMRRHTISARLLKGYLGRPYEFFLNRHTGALTKAILNEVDTVIHLVMQPAVLMLGNLVSLAAIAVMLLVVDPVIALGAAGVLSAAYLMIYGKVRSHLVRSGERRLEADSLRFRTTSETLGGIKDIKLLGREARYFTRFSNASEAVAREYTKSLALSDVPRYAIEAVAFGGIILICVLLLTRSGSADAALAEVLPLLGLFAFAGYRMMPAIQAIYRAVTQIGFGASAVETLYRDLTENIEHSTPFSTVPAPPLRLKKELKLDGVTYRYPGNNRAGIYDIAVTVPALSTLGIVGGTGAGKTTLVDVILGLLGPQEGRILADGQVLNSETMSSWRAGIGYVPQDIFLLDASIAENIALGQGSKEIDMTQVVRSASMARLDQFIADLAEGYDTHVGERGVRLSGGQRQRIGIARALYHNPDVIVFDEATSALDNATENEVMAAIDGLAGRKTVIMIAHRLTTVARCDRIVVLERGRIAGVGTFEALSKESAAFQRIAQSARSEPR